MDGARAFIFSTSNGQYVRQNHTHRSSQDEEAIKAEFVRRLEEVFTHIRLEETFVKASLQHDFQDPQCILNYEVWHETPDSFVKTSCPRSIAKVSNRH